MSWLDSIPPTWTNNFSQKRRGDPRGFINDPTTKAALWASKDVYYGNVQSAYEGWKQIALIPVQPRGTGQTIARLGGGDLRVKVYQNEQTNSIMIAFEGTRNMTGVWQDIQMFQPIRADFVVPGARGQLHSGFAGVYQAIRDELQQLVGRYPTSQVVFTGHSLGGAVASIASADTWPGHRVSTITVGAPQVGDQEFSTWYGNTGHTQNRIIQKSDPITIGNLKYVHADDGAWVIGQDNAWIDFSKHGIHAYLDAAENVNSRYSLDDDGYIYKEAHAFVTTLDLAKDVHRAYKYYQAAQEFYEFTQLASGLPQTGETLRQIVFTQEGVLSKGFQMTVDKLQQFKFPTRQEFKDIFVQRVVELQDQADVIKALDAPLKVLGPSKYVDVGGLVESGLADIAPDIIRPLSNVDVLSEGVPLSWADELALTTTDNTILAKASNVFAKASDSASNYFKILTESDAVLGAKSMLQSTSNTLSQLARPLTSGITNIWAGSQGVRNWVTKAVPKAMSVGGFMLNALSFGTGIADLVKGDTSATNIVGTTIAGLGTLVAGIEAAAAVGLVSSSVLTASIGAGITIPVVGQILAVAGLITFAISWFLRPKRKSQEEIEEERQEQITQFTQDSLKRIGMEAYGQGVPLEGVDTKDKSAEQIGQEFMEKNQSKVSYNSTTNQLELKQGGPLVDLIYPPIHLADGQVLHADDPHTYRQGKIAQEAYTILSQSGLVQGTQTQFVSEHYKDFDLDQGVLQGRKGGFEKDKLPQELKDQFGILYKGQPFQDVFLPEMKYRGQRIYPSKDPKLYQQVQLANNIWDGMEQFGLGEKQAFIDKFAAEFEMQGEQITIDGKDFKDAIFPPLYGVEYSKNPGAYENMALSKHLYQELVDAGLSTGGLAEKEFVGNYFSHMNLDDQGNLKIDGVDAMDYYYDPITNLDGQTFFRYQDPEGYDKAQAFYRAYDELNDKYKQATGHLLPPTQLWDEIGASIQMLSGHQMAFGLTKQELVQPDEQLQLLAQVEQRAIQMGIPVDQKKLQEIRFQIEQSSFNDTLGNGFHLSGDNQVLLGPQPLINQIAANYMFNGRVFEYNQNPKDYLNGLNYRNDSKIASMPPSQVEELMKKTLGQVRLPDSHLNSYTGYLTKSIGPVSYTLPEPQVLTHAFSQLNEDGRQAYEEYKADVTRIEEETRKKRLEEFTTYTNPMEKPEPVLRAVDRIYDQLVRMGVSIQMTKDEFDRLYAPQITFDNNGTVLIHGKPKIPLPIPIEYEGRQIFQVDQPELYEQIQAASTVFDQLVAQGQMTDKNRPEFLQQYKDQFQVAVSGQIQFQGNYIGQSVPHPNLSVELPKENAVEMDTSTSTDALPNPFDSMKGQIRTPQGGFGPTEPVDLPNPKGQNAIFNPLQNVESKIGRLTKPIHMQPDLPGQETETEEEQFSAMYSGGIHSIPGSVGFQANGEKLKASLSNNLWVIHFENGESDTYPRQRNLMGYTLMGNWTGATPLANGGPINTLDSYMLAYHVQSKYSVMLSASYLKQRCQAAINNNSINPYTDVREFNIAQEILSMPPGQDIWTIEASDHEASYNLSAQLQQKLSEVMDHRIVPSSLPTHVDREKLLLIPKTNPQENMMKRCIEAAGIIEDFQVQNKLRKVLSDYQAYEFFSEQYMEQVSIAQGDVIVPNMKRRVLEGIIARDEIYEEICSEWVRLISQPLAQLFQVQ